MKRLLLKLNKIYNVIPRYKTSIFTLDEQTREQLEALGYINDIEHTIGNAHEPSRIENHWLEAENADTIVNPLKVANDERASEGRYIYSPNGTGNQYTPGHVMATYIVNISQAGTYVLWGRVRVSDKRDNSFFVQLDDNEDNLWEVETSDFWHWDEVNDRIGPDQVKFTLTSGVHTIKIKLREDGTKLDKLLLTNDTNFVPSGKETLPKIETILKIIE